jgi:hypothetical protein
MKISGFSFARNADKLGYPVEESIRSVLPICDEFILALGKGDAGDHTRELVESIGDEKIVILDTEWTDIDKLKGNIYSRQTNIALQKCTGDWCFYIQCDEAVHEKYLPSIKKRCEELLFDRSVEGLLFDYKHFWGDYDHHIISHKWYSKEIRMIRNKIGVESVGDAQSFKKNGKKLHVALACAEIYHYGYVRPPQLMQSRNRAITATYWGKIKAETMITGESFDFGSFEKIPVFKETHPAVMNEKIKKMDWKDKLDYSGKSTARLNHDRLKYRILTFIEQHFLGGNHLGGYKNYILLKGK